ncbi:hypothetical protein MNBD_ALPHA09-1630 [hydrothermal vent metagenome]|uniref:DUF721 domain-containing protein n=1 Tax=hydrothermal vent metagenome TaxID=652676 RepID=A0A3B0T1T2_9ZZZZ
MAGKRRKGIWTIGHIAAQVTGGVFERHGLGRGEIAHAWPHIVGTQLAHVCRPERLAPPQKGARGGGKRVGGTLHIVTSGAHAIDVHYAATRIIAGVNALYGHQIISRINVKTATAEDTSNAARHGAAAFRPSVAEPEDPMRFGDIRNTGLRHALARLEAGILAEATLERTEM